MIQKNVLIKSPYGIHTRISATLVNKASEIKSKYNVDLLIKRQTDSSFIAISMLALISLKIQQFETITISTNDNNINSLKAIDEFCAFIEKDLSTSTNKEAKLDEILEENTIANEQILDNLPVGIIVIDVNCSVMKINKYALQIVNMSHQFAIGKYVKDVIPSSELHNVIINGKKQLGKIQHINNRILMVNRSPLYKDNEVIGAVGVFQDVSELVGMKELNENFKKILETSHDLICFVDDDRHISYINPSYEKFFHINANDIQGKDLIDIAPDGLRMKVFNTRKKLENVIWQKDGIEIISTLDPIFIDNEFKGVISTSKVISEMKDIMSQLAQSKQELSYYKKELMKHTKGNPNFKDIIGKDTTLKSVLNICEKASKSTSTVLIRGESGTGKELIAKAIHYNSDRKHKPFVRVNCAAIPENLLESELFGYEKGAFTGALKHKPGKFSIANSGTIFLDEIGDMPTSMQVKLLRVIQEKEIESLGGLSPQKVDVRIIAATHRPLEEMIEKNTFREDLYYRLNVLSVNLPPLRERKEDINTLVHHFIDKFNKELKKNMMGIDKESLNLLEAYDWPGNIRELQNIVERAINLCDENIISSKDIPLYIQGFKSSTKDPLDFNDDNLLTFQEYDKKIIELAMKKYKTFNKAGKALGITHRTVSLKCKKYGIKY